jgi:1,5-anhydro-D-fructose reductase (1,5-anhydro-D-mannitol-forming)
MNEEAKTVNSKRILGWGLIGASNIARQYMIPAINGQPDSKVMAVMSRSAERASEYARQNGIMQAYDSVDALLDDPDVDVIYISTTNERHMEETLAAAAAGKHVLCEKPLALELEDAIRMVETCREAGVVMGTNHHLRNAATHRTMHRLVKEGAIGRPLAARVFHAVFLPPNLQTWRIKSPAKGAGVVLDITVHDTDTLRFVLGQEVEEVMAISENQGMAESGVSDAVMGVMRFDGGVLAQFHDAFTIRHGGTGFQIHGTEGSLFGKDVMTQNPVGRVFLRRNDETEAVDIGAADDLYTTAVGRFNSAIRGKGSPAATGEDGIRSLAVALAVGESTRTGKTVPVVYS